VSPFASISAVGDRIKYVRNDKPGSEPHQADDLQGVFAGILE
jgi:hypothetical protein